MKRNYSRLASTEEKRNMRRAVLFSFLTIGAIIMVVLFGLPSVAKFAAFLTDLRKGNQPIEINDTTPPSPPRINTLPEATKEKSIDINGNAEAGATVVMDFNGKEEEIVAGSDGTFSFSLALRKGENKIAFVAKDTAGNVSQETETFTIIFDDEEPKLEITTPPDGEEFFGSKERQITIQGTTDPEATLTINERPIKVEESGEFTYVTTLNEGDNSFNAKSVDKAGNTTEVSLTVKFSP